MEIFSIDFELFQGIAMPLVGVASSFLGCLIWTSNIINPGFLHPASEMIIIICNSFFVFVPCMDELSWIWIESNWLELTRIEWTNKLHAALTRFVLAGLKHLLGTLTEPCEVPIYEDYLTQIFFKQNKVFFFKPFLLLDQPHGTYSEMDHLRIWSTSPSWEVWFLRRRGLGVLLRGKWYLPDSLSHVLLKEVRQ